MITRLAVQSTSAGVIGRHRVVQITSRADFPEPFDRLAGGAVWLVEDVEAWITEHRPHQARGADPDAQ